MKTKGEGRIGRTGARSRLLTAVCTLCFSAAVFSSTVYAGTEGTWERTEDGKYWQYFYTPDRQAIDEWIEIDGKEYYFDSKGIAATGELKLGLEKCKFSESGELLSKEKTEIDPGKPMVALTFDDGPGPRTSEILDQLKKYNAHATFFMLGKNVIQRFSY